MIMGRDFDIKLQRYNDSLKEVLKQTMLNQEVIFRKQVHELHRLYNIQKTLMDDLSWKESDRHSLWNTGTICRPPAKERTVIAPPMVASTKKLPEKYLRFYHQFQHGPLNLQQRPLDPEFPVDEYICHSGKNAEMKSISRDPQMGPIEVQHSFHVDNDPDDLKLSLSISDGAKTKDHESSRTWYGKNESSCSRDIIDLERSAQEMSDENADTMPLLGFVAPTPQLKDHFSSMSDPLGSTSVKKNLAPVSTLVCFLMDGKERAQGSKEQLDNMPSSGLYTGRKEHKPHKRGLLDLNTVQLDDSFCHLNDPVATCPSTSSSSGVSHGNFGKSQQGFCHCGTCCSTLDDCFDRTGNLCADKSHSSCKDVASTHDWTCRVNHNGINGSDFGLADPDLVSGPLLEHCENFKSHIDELQSENLGLSMELPDGSLQDDKGNNLDMMDANFKKSGKDNELSCPYENTSTVLEECHHKSSSTSCKSDCGADNSSSIKTMQSGTHFGDSNPTFSNGFLTNQSGTHVAENPLDGQDLRSSDSSKSTNQCDHKKGPAEVDVLIQMAAEALVHISLESCTPQNEIQIKETQQPQYSSDSYESIALRQPEMSADDYAVSSKPFEVCETEKRDSGPKLRRGRRLKDFQRDILPGLASLARHEICEDINIMEGVIRSREYRRLRSRISVGENWSAPLAGINIEDEFTVDHH
ncbi:Protein of unknown function DUF863, plant, partial [Dillenia turbinata]